VSPKIFGRPLLRKIVKSIPWPLSRVPRLRRKTSALQMVSIDVEGGGGTLFVTPDGKSLLIDTGNPSRAASPATSQLRAHCRGRPCAGSQEDRLPADHPLSRRPYRRLEGFCAAFRSTP
jgi:hypothetical protein